MGRVQCKSALSELGHEQAFQREGFVEPTLSDSGEEDLGRGEPLVPDTMLAWGAGGSGPWRAIGLCRVDADELFNVATFLALSNEDPSQVREASTALSAAW